MKDKNPQDQNKIYLKFRRTITSMATLKKQEVYKFSFTKEQIEEAKKRDWKHPLIITDRPFGIIALYSQKGKLQVLYYISFYGFEEGLGTHRLKKKFKNSVMCQCHELFYDSPKKTAMERLKEHIKHWKKLGEE